MLMPLDISEISSMIQGLNSYNLLTDKLAKKVLWTIYTADKKKSKNYRSIENELSIKGNTWSHQILILPQFPYMSEKIVEFIDSTNKIYWATNIAKKAAKCWKKSFYICQY